MIYMIDNFDSFTYNLVQLFGMIGADIEVFRNNAINIDKIAADRPDGIVISPGPGTPDDAGVSLEVIRAFAGKIPILGVCLGHQGIGAAFGGKVIRAPELMHGKLSQIDHDGRTVFREVPSPFTATRYHSLILEEDSLPSCFEISARSDSGLIMGIRHRQHLLEGVQFHPESIMTEAGEQIIANFITMTKEHAHASSDSKSH